MNERDSLRVLQGLDETTEWELDGDLLAANDPDDDGGLATLPAPPHLHPIDGGREDSLDLPNTAESIIDTVKDMQKNGVIEDILVVINTQDGDQFLMCNLERNDHIIGMITVAQLNWHSSQIAASNYYEEEE